MQKELEKKGVHVLSAGPDEVPYVYKDIDAVMAQQQDLVEVVGRFDPRIVKMSGDGRAEGARTLETSEDAGGGHSMKDVPHSRSDTPLAFHGIAHVAFDQFERCGSRTTIRRCS